MSAVEDSTQVFALLDSEQIFHVLDSIHEKYGVPVDLPQSPTDQRLDAFIDQLIQQLESYSFRGDD